MVRALSFLREDFFFSFSISPTFFPRFFRPLNLDLFISLPLSRSHNLSLWKSFRPFSRRRQNPDAAATDQWHPQATPTKKRPNGGGNAAASDDDDDNDGVAAVERHQAAPTPERPRFNWSLHKEVEEEGGGMEVDDGGDGDGASDGAVAAAAEEEKGRLKQPQLVVVAPAAATLTSPSSSSPLSSAAAPGLATPPVGLHLQHRPPPQASAPSKESEAEEETPEETPANADADTGDDGDRGRETRERDELAYSSLRARWAAAAASEDFRAVAPGSERARELVPACRITTGARAAAEKKKRAAEEAEATAKAAAAAAEASSSKA